MVAARRDTEHPSRRFTLAQGGNDSTRRRNCLSGWRVPRYPRLLSPCCCLAFSTINLRHDAARAYGSAPICRHIRPMARTHILAALSVFLIALASTAVAECFDINADPFERLVGIVHIDEERAGKLIAGWPLVQLQVDHRHQRHRPRAYGRRKPLQRSSPRKTVWSALCPWRELVKTPHQRNPACLALGMAAA